MFLIAFIDHSYVGCTLRITTAVSHLEIVSWNNHTDICHCLLWGRAVAGFGHVLIPVLVSVEKTTAVHLLPQELRLSLRLSRVLLLAYSIMQGFPCYVKMWIQTDHGLNKSY